MSIPTNQLVYAGVWNVTTRYPTYQFVLSPIDNQCYINTSSSPVTGGSDPSVQPSTIWTFFPNVTGDITGITAGTGITGGGTSGNVTISNAGVLTVSAGNGMIYQGTAQNPILANNGVLTVGAGTGLSATGTAQNRILANAGVLSLDTQTGAVVTKCGQWYKTSVQTVNTVGSPTVTILTWDNATGWSDTSTLTWDAPNSQFIVNSNGLYHLQCQVMYANFGSATFSDTTHEIHVNITRTIPPPDPNAGTYANSPIRTSFDWDNGNPTIPDNFVAGIYELKVGDRIQLELRDFLSAGSFDINPQSAGGNFWDYNTFFTWSMIKPLP